MDLNVPLPPWSLAVSVSFIINIIRVGSRHCSELSDDNVARRPSFCRCICRCQREGQLIIIISSLRFGIAQAGRAAVVAAWPLSPGRRSGLPAGQLGHLTGVQQISRQPENGGTQFTQRLFDLERELRNSPVLLLLSCPGWASCELRAAERQISLAALLSFDCANSTATSGRVSRSADCARSWPGSLFFGADQ